MHDGLYINDKDLVYSSEELQEFLYRHKTACTATATATTTTTGATAAATARALPPSPRRSNIKLCSEPSCLSPGTMTCGACEIACYCSAVCQKKHWRLKPYGHKAECKDAKDHDRTKESDGGGGGGGGGGGDGATVSTAALASDWSSLPPDIIINIALKLMNGSSKVKYEFSMPTAHDGQGTLKVLSQVCSGWRFVLIGTPLLWRVYVRKTFRDLKHNHATELVVTIRRSHHLLFAAASTIQDVLVAKDDLQQCSRLTELDLLSTPSMEPSEETHVASELKMLLSNIPTIKKVWLPPALLGKAVWSEIAGGINRDNDTCDACDFEIVRNKDDDDDDDEYVTTKCDACLHVSCCEEHADGTAALHRKWNRKICGQPHGALASFSDPPTRRLGIGLSWCEACGECKCKACGDVDWCETCSMSMCMECCPVCVCDVCNKSQCMECIWTDTCGMCNMTSCSECCPVNECEGEGCATTSCRDCSDVAYCHACGECWCRECRLTFWCNECSEVKCVDCAEFSECIVCENMFCSECHNSGGKFKFVCTTCFKQNQKIATKNVEEASKAQHVFSTKVGLRLSAKLKELERKKAESADAGVTADSKKQRYEALSREDSDFTAFAHMYLGADTRDIDALVADINGPATGAGGSKAKSPSKAKTKTKKKKKKR